MGSRPPAKPGANVRKPPEPRRLQEGKAFHAKVQADWKTTAEGTIATEKPVQKPNGRRGRIDIHADSGDGDSLIAVVEIKHTDWDAMSEAVLKRNVHRQSRQVWAYIEAELAQGRQVSPGIIFPNYPRMTGRLRLIESLFEWEGIAVAWEDETIEERRRRAEEEEPGR